MIDKVYIVEAFFDGYESSWSNMIGTFTDVNVAEKIKDKWNEFYKENKTIFDGLDPNSDDEVGKYYRTLSMYGEIQQFTHASVTEVILNKDVYIDSDSMRTDTMDRLIKEWERDYKLKEILK